MIQVRNLMRISFLLCDAPIATQAAAQVAVVKDPPKIGLQCKPWDNDADCVIRVKVTPPGGEEKACKVDLLDPAQSMVGVKRGTRILLLWVIDNPPAGYGFDSNDGIDFVNDPPPRQFAWPSRWDQGADPSTFFWWTNKNNRLRANYYEYEINVRNKDGTVRCYVPDRSIKNQ